MPTANHIQNSFSAGEISPRLEGRTDFEKYRDGCRTLHNFKVFPHGGVTRRGGTQFIAEVKDSSKTVRLVPFEFSITQAYILEFGDLYIRFYRDRGQIGAPYEIVSPYAEADLADLQFAQNADTMYIVHKDVAPQKLTRTGHTAWTIEDVEFLDVTQDITAITQANPAVVTITGHPLLDGATVKARDIKGMTELNKRSFTVANKTANTFELAGEDSTGHTAYISGGTIRKEETTISGLTHLEGETVTILGDGAPQPSRVVASGAIILETAASIIHVGLGFDSELETVRPDVGSADGSAQGKIKRVKEAVARFYNTVGGKIGRLNGEMDEIQFRAPSDPMDEHVPLFTGDKEIAFPKGYDTEGIVAVKQDQPLPMTLLAIVYKLKTNSL